MVYRCISSAYRRVTYMYEGVDDLCNVHSGYTTVTDDDGLPHRVYMSVTRDGSVWLRVGPDHTSLDWVYVDERRVHFHTVILSADDIHLLQVSSHCNWTNDLITTRTL